MRFGDAFAHHRRSRDLRVVSDEELLRGREEAIEVRAPSPATLSKYEISPLKLVEGPLDSPAVPLARSGLPAGDLGQPLLPWPAELLPRAVVHTQDPVDETSIAREPLVVGDGIGERRIAPNDWWLAPARGY